jgi:ankyrin repeat protein
VNLVTNTGWSGLIGAATYGHVESLKILLAASNIDVNLADEEGDTAIKMAADDGHEAAVRMLLEVPGIKTDVRCTRDGHTAKSIAIANGHDGVVRLLEEFESRMIHTSDSGATLVVGSDSSLSKEQAVAEFEGDSDSDASEYFEDAKEWSESDSDIPGLSESYVGAEG